ncbi:hypothetical protein HMPREF3181_00783 [Parvimonas sp. KA00067]|nr:hypothetical protein HMPREF3181_00783 [Parvimonas sp. KA00067]
MYKIIKILYNNINIKVGISMITRQKKKMDRVQIISMEDLVPKEHLLRKI